jgi:hypothetical protein
LHDLLKIEGGFRLLNFAFFVFNMLARNRVIFPSNHFLSHGACVFLGHIKSGQCPRWNSGGS